MTTEERDSVIELLTGLIKHPMIKEAHIADVLFYNPQGKENQASSNRSRFNHRMKGRFDWQAKELRDILKIFEDFADKIDQVRDAVANIPEMRADFEELLTKLLPQEPAQEDEDTEHEDATEEEDKTPQEVDKEHE